MITDNGLRALTGQCKKLDDLSVRGCGQIRGVGFLADTLGGSMLVNICEEMRILDIGGCALVTDAAVTWVSDSCVSLRELRMGGCGKVGDGGLAAVARRCRSLQILDVSR